MSYRKNSSTPSINSGDCLLLNWLITPLYVVVFIFILVLFHPLLVIAGCINTNLHRWLLNRMNCAILWNMRITGGVRFQIDYAQRLPEDRAILLISNHQSMYDIPLIMWTLRPRRVGFVAKKELGKWLPSISYSLRRLDSVLIDRRDSAQALAAIRGWGSRMASDKNVACIFPEGTRARDGRKRRFKPAGVLALMESMPEAVIQPVVISGAWEFLRYNFLPVPWGVSVKAQFLPPIVERAEENAKLLELIERDIESLL